MNLERAYGTLLRLYPYDFKALFALDMLSSFEQESAERRRQSRLALQHFVVREFFGVLIGAGEEWIAKVTTDRWVRGRYLPDLRMMRPPGVRRELWFPRTCLKTTPASLPDEVIDRS